MKTQLQDIQAKLNTVAQRQNNIEKKLDKLLSVQVQERQVYSCEVIGDDIHISALNDVDSDEEFDDFIKNTVQPNLKIISDDYITARDKLAILAAKFRGEIIDTPKIIKEIRARARAKGEEYERI